MRIVFKGWIGKSIKRKSDLAYITDTCYDVCVDMKRGSVGEWCVDDWPPRKVTVTITDEEAL